MAHILRAGLVQQACVPDSAENQCKTEASIRQAAGQGAKLVVLQELFGTRYFCQEENADSFELAEPIPGPSTKRLGDVARELDIVIAASLFERRAAGLYHNTVVVLERDGSPAGMYRKMHIPDDPGYYEKYYFTPGDLGFEPIDTSIGRLGVLICWDQWFPEAARLMALAGADLLIYPTAIGWDPRDCDAEKTRQLEAWRTVQRGHAVANALPVLAINRCGFEPDPSGRTGGILFWGASFACGPQGEIRAQAPSGEDAVLTVDLDLEQNERIRRSWPFFRDRRTDAYRELLSRWRDG